MRLQEAELKAKQAEDILTPEEFEKANELQAKANSRGMKLVPERRVKSNVRFVQVMQENWSFLQSQSYLKSEDIVFLMSLIPYIALHSNKIVENPKLKNPAPLNQSELAAALGTSKTKVSRVVNNLVKKGIMARTESGVEDNNARAYALSVNPHILFAGDRDKIEEGLKTDYYKAMKMKVIKDLPIRLF